MKFLLPLFFLILFHPTHCFAGPIYFGPELEFRNTSQLLAFIDYEKIRNLSLGEKMEYFTSVSKLKGLLKPMEVFTEANIKAMTAMHNEMSAMCAGRHDCMISDIQHIVESDKIHSFKVNYPEKKFWFMVTMDPGVIEVKMGPATVKTFREMAPIIEKDLYARASAVGLTPPKISGSGHVHIDLKSAFGDDALLFRNFIVDFTNHSELATGVLLRDTYNAPALNLDQNKRAAFERVIRDFDEGRITTIDDLARQIQDRVYGKMLDRKYQALNLTKILKSDVAARTVEIRSIRAERNFEQFVKISEMFEARIEYLKKVGKPIPYQNVAAIDDRVKGVKAFYQYITESGLDYKKYKPLLLPHWRLIRLTSQGKLYPDPFNYCSSFILKLLPILNYY